MELAVLSNGQKTSTFDFPDSLAARAFNEVLVHQVATAYLAGARQGTQSQKSRSDCRGGGAKPWRQKGTGRARSGTLRSPIWRGGGVAFAANPRDFSQKMNRKAYRAAMLSIIAELLRQERLKVIDAPPKLETPKTRLLLEQLSWLESDRILLVTKDQDVNLYLASRNLSQVKLMTVARLSPIDLLTADPVLFTVSALEAWVEAY